MNPSKQFWSAKWAIGTLVLLCLKLAVAQTNSTTLYATGNKGNELLTIDLRSGTVNVIGATGYPFSLGLAFSPAGTAYTITNMGSMTLAQLATLDVNTGAATLIGQPLGQSLMVMGVIVSPQGVLYGGAMPSGIPPTSIYSIDTTTGLSTFVGSSGTSGELMSFAYDPQGTLYTASPTSLYTVDLTTGNATLVTPLTIGAVMGLAVDSDGIMYATNFVPCPPCSSVYRIDPITGTATWLFNTGIPFVHNIAFNPGAPTDQLIALESRISKLTLPRGIATGLDAKLSAELNALNNEDSSTACNISGSFQNEVDALSGKLISEAGLQQLNFANTRLRTALGCQ
jgi:DNA-binding beta-propeller fold protein YncE